MERFCVGVDVSAKTLVTAWRGAKDVAELREFANDKSGHRALVKQLKKRASGTIRVVLEATGIYGLELAIALDLAGFEVMVANPRATANFAKAILQRSKTDKLDAEMLLRFAETMAFIQWHAPTSAQKELRAISRRVQAVLESVRAEKCRQHAAEYQNGIGIVRKSIKSSIKSLEAQVVSLRKEAIKLIETDALLARRFELLVTVKGIGRISAISILAEVSMLPADMTDRQWVAHAGLDPRKFDSGTSVHKVSRISKRGNKYLRAVLYLPAQSASRFDPGAVAFKTRLRAAGKEPLQVHVAVMRKMLHGIRAMFANDQPYDSARLFPAAAGVVGTSGIAPFAISEVSTTHCS